MNLSSLLIIVCAIAAINWGLVTLIQWNAVEVVTPEETPLRMLREPVYLVIGAAGIAVLLSVFGVLKL